MSTTLDSAVDELEYAPRFLVNLGRKVEIDDMNAPLQASAEMWLLAYTGDFDYLLDVRGKMGFRVVDGRRVALGHLSVGQAKGVLNCWRADLLRAQPKADLVGSLELKEGRFALGEEPNVRFYRIAVRPKYIGVLRVIGGREDQWLGTASKLLGQPGQVREDLLTIAGDPQPAAQLYGQKIGRCGRCGRHLTDPVSREFGIGPECRGKGW